MKLSTKIILPIILISALLILLAGCFGVPADESPGYTPGTITGIIASPCCSLSSDPADGETASLEYWCYWCQNTWDLQDGIEVVLTYGEDEVATTTTNQFGEFTFTDVTPGKNYVITAYCPDFADNRPLVKDVALELIEGGSFDTKITDLVSTSLGLVVDFLVLYTEMGPEDISLIEVIADKPSFPNFPKFKKLVYEVRRVLENCEVNMLTDDDLQDALCFASEEVGRVTFPDLVIGCVAGYTPPPPEPDPCDGNVAPVIDEVILNGTTVSSPSTQDLVVGTSYTVVINASDDNILPKPANPLTYSLTITKGTDPSFDIDMGTTNTFTGTPLIGDVGTYTVYVNVNDGCTTTPWGPVTVEVHDECYNNDGPFLTMPANATVDPNPVSPYTWSVIGNDPDGILGTPLEYSLVSVVPTPISGFTVDPISGEISWDPTCEDIKDRVDTVYTVTVEVYDGCDTDEGSFDVTLNAEPCDCFGNIAPSLTMPANASVDPGGSYSWSVTATDDGIKQALSYSLVSVVPDPHNLFTVDAISGEISWDPTCEDIKDRVDTVYTVTVEVYDGCDTDEGSFDVTLNAEPCDCFGNIAPSLTMPANASVDPGGSYSWSVTATDDGIKQALSYSLVSVVPDPHNLFTVDAISGEISWDPTCEDIKDRVDTVYTVTVEVYDGCDTDEGSFDVTLNAEPCDCFGNIAPSLTMPANASVDPGGSYSWSVTATDDGIKQALSYSLVSVVPDPHNLFTVDAISGEISWDPTCEDIKDRVDTVYTVTVEVYDGCDTDEGSFDVTLNAEPCDCFGNIAPSLTMPANASVDPGGSYSWSVTATDDGIKQALSYSLVSVVPDPHNLFTVDAISGEISWDPTCEDIKDRVDTVYTVTVEVYDGCDTDEGSFDVTLNAEPCDCFGNIAPSLTMPANASVDPGGSYSWSVTATDDGIKQALSYSLVSVVPDPHNLFTVDAISGEISWDPDCNDIIGRVDTVYTVTVEVYDGCDTDEGSFDVTLYAESCEPCELAELTIFTNKIPNGYVIDVGDFTPLGAHLYEYELILVNEDNNLTFIPLLTGNCEGFAYYQWKNEGCNGSIFEPIPPAEAISNVEYPTADVVPSKKFTVCNPPDYNILYLYIGEGVDKDTYQVIVRRELK